MRNIVKIYLFILVITAGMWQCVDAPNFSDTPEIAFLSMSKDTIDQGVFQEDSLTVFFSFQDGDGDLGLDNQASENNVFFIDTRTDVIDNTFRIPFIPSEGSSNGIEGIVKIALFSTCCIFPEGGPDPCQPSATYPYDEVQYRIYITDRAGNKSNEILTDPITLRCN